MHNLSSKLYFYLREKKFLVQDDPTFTHVDKLTLFTTR